MPDALDMLEAFVAGRSSFADDRMRAAVQRWLEAEGRERLDDCIEDLPRSPVAFRLARRNGILRQAFSTYRVTESFASRVEAFAGELHAMTRKGAVWSEGAPPSDAEEFEMLLLAALKFGRLPASGKQLDRILRGHDFPQTCPIDPALIQWGLNGLRSKSA